MKSLFISFRLLYRIYGRVTTQRIERAHAAVVKKCLDVATDKQHYVGLDDLVFWLLNNCFALRRSIIDEHSSRLCLPRQPSYCQPSKRKGMRHHRDAARISACDSNGQDFRRKCTVSPSSSTSLET